MKGFHGILREGDKISLARLQKKEPFLVAWVGGKDKPAGQIGVSAIDSNSSFWDDVLEGREASALDADSVAGNSPRQATSKTNAAGAGR